MRTSVVREALEEQLGTVDEVMERRVVTVRPDDPVGDAARALERACVSGGPVVEDGRVVGMVSLAQIFRAAQVPDHAATSGPWHRFEHQLDRIGLRVREVMTPGAVTLPAGSPLAAAAALMRSGGVNRIPILDEGGALRGIVSRDHVVAAVAAAFEGGAR